MAISGRTNSTGISFVCTDKLIIDIKSGCVAGDEESYDTFADLMDPIIERRHNGYAKDAKHKTDLNPDNIKGGDDLDDNYVLSSRVRTGRSIRGYVFFYAVDVIVTFHFNHSQRYTITLPNNKRTHISSSPKVHWTPKTKVYGKKIGKAVSKKV